MFKRYYNSLSNLNDIEFLETDLKKITPWMIDILLKSEKQRDELINYLLKNGIETRIFYPPIHKLTPYKKSSNEFKDFSIKVIFFFNNFFLPSLIVASINLALKPVCFLILMFILL